MITTVLLDCGDRQALATADEPPPALSFKCSMYGLAPSAHHTPCSGTTDDGTDRACECKCHGVPRVTYPMIKEHPVDPGDKMTCVTCGQNREVVTVL
jgi:hypothetical protein